MTSKDHFIKACEILQERGIIPVRHFSPFDESGKYESGSGWQIFWDGGGKRYDFLFNDQGKCTWSS